MPTRRAVSLPLVADRAGPPRGGALFAAAERLDLEGIVAKRKADPYGPDSFT